MKKSVQLVLCTMLSSWAIGQNANLVLSGAGVRMVSSGSPELVIQNGNLQNNASAASVVPGNGTVRFLGTSSDALVGGSAPIRFYTVRINKLGFKADLSTDISVSNELELIEGDFNMNNQLVDMDTSGNLSGEVYPAGRRLYCDDGQTGRIRAVRRLFSGANTDIAGLGLDLNVTGTAPDTTTIIRGHDSQTSTAFPGAGTSIGRYYDITPQVNTGFTYQFVFRYNENELGLQTGPDEANFLFYRSPSYGSNTADWQQWGAPVVGINTPGYPTVTWASHDPASNVVGLSGINTFSRWTVSNSVVAPLPIELISFDAICAEQGVLLTWKTASEINNEKFIIHRSTDLQHWEELQQVEGAGNSNQERSYSAWDERPIEALVYYRLTQMDFDGTQERFDPIAILCNASSDATARMSAYPNPTDNVFTVSVYSPENKQGALLTFYDLNGKQVFQKTVSLSEGVNTYLFDRWDLKSGTYVIQLYSDLKGIKPIKLIVN